MPPHVSLETLVILDELDLQMRRTAARLAALARRVLGRQLAAEGITTGCSVNKYCPNQSVTRAEMAVFLVRTFDIP